jgi:hypothetical protein
MGGKGANLVVLIIVVDFNCCEGISIELVKYSGHKVVGLWVAPVVFARVDPLCVLHQFRPNLEVGPRVAKTIVPNYDICGGGDNQGGIGRGTGLQEREGIDDRVAADLVEERGRN